MSLACIDLSNYNILETNKSSLGFNSDRIVKLIILY